MKQIKTQQESQVRAFSLQIKSNSDKLMNYFLVGYFLVGLLLSAYYDTWLIGIGVGGLSLASYYCAKYFLPDSNLYQYVLGAVFGIFMAQFIYQMHGMFEMHFFAFIGSAILITYQNWRLQIPLALVVVVHHAIFGYLQFIGFDQIFFTPLNYMTLETFIIHGFLASTIFFLCGLWAYNFKSFSKKHIRQSFEIGKLLEADKQKEAFITERKIAEEALIESEKRYRLVSENSFLGISWTSSDGQLINTNNAFDRLMGYSKEEILNKHFSELSHPEDVERDVPFIHQMKKGEIDNYQTEKRFVTKDNQTIWAELNLTAIKNTEEDYRIAIIQDITSRKQAEEKLESTLRELEKRVEERTKDLSVINKTLRDEINEKVILSRVIEKKNKDITDSINYAKRIQRSFLPKDEKFAESFKDYFILNMPKDVVSGDFYWLENVNTTPATGESKNVSVISVVDCTGHGIPGALVSIVGNTLLNQTIKNKDVNTPADALNFLNRELPKNLKKQKGEGEIRDGMDMVICAFDLTAGNLHFSGANNSVYIIRENKLSIMQGQHQAISASESELKKEFTNSTFDLKKDDCVYLFTDGYEDQFGGNKGKKFKRKQLQDLLLAHAHLAMSEQQQMLNDAMEKWKGDHEQVDDILIIGIRV